MFTIPVFRFDEENIKKWYFDFLMDNDLYMEPFYKLDEVLSKYNGRCLYTDSKNYNFEFENEEDLINFIMKWSIV